VDKRTSIARRLLAAGFNPLARILDKLYRSEYNPLYRSGTLAIGMLLVLLVTGLYLLFFYNVSAPYESIERIQSQVWLGRWIRAMHRYATDIAIVATVFHILQMLIQGRSWGSRVLAWISGVLLLGALMFSAWTGYVMVWDRHGQWLAEAGAQLGATAPFLHDTVMRTFGGAEPLTGSFFFMNLFLHVAIPLVMVLGIWIHTAHLAKPRWLPHAATFVSLIAALLVVSVLIAAPMLPKADLLSLTSRMPVDLFTSFWLPLVDAAGGGATFIMMLAISLAMVLVPWWWQGNRSAGPAVVDSVSCIGCAKCSRDCPFEAITMTTRSDGSRLLLSVVNPDRCVECGLCVASCNDNAITLPGLSLPIQQQEVDELITPDTPLDETIPVLVYCQTNPGIDRTLTRLRGKFPGLICLGVRCAGALHADAVSNLLKRAPGVLLVTCPEENCRNRWGHDLAFARMSNTRKPGLELPDEQARIRVIAQSGHEYRAMASALSGLAPQMPSPRWVSWLRTAAAHAILVLVMAVCSAWELGAVTGEAAFRTFLSLPGFSVEQQVEWTEQEKKDMPAHMRLPRNVTRRAIHYQLSMDVDGEHQHTHELRARRDGQEVRFTHEVRMSPGPHRITLALTMDHDEKVHTIYNREVTLSAGGVEVFAFDGKAELSGERMQMRKE
jgi:NAD-dependent dihydropyrimidine dehydrogenase PreA subunit/coenzyme F420-reducing hydrogenase delta subunit